MTILHHSDSSLIVASDTALYQYGYVPAWYVAKARRLARHSEGKAWQVLRKFRVVAKGAR